MNNDKIITQITKSLQQGKFHAEQAVKMFTEAIEQMEGLSKPSLKREVKKALDSFQVNALLSKRRQARIKKAGSGKLTA